MLEIMTSPPTVPPTAAPIMTPLLRAATETGEGYADHMLPEYVGIGMAGVVIDIDIEGVATAGPSLTST
jgi:hypothetical protein